MEVAQRVEDTEIYGYAFPSSGKGTTPLTYRQSESPSFRVVKAIGEGGEAFVHKVEIDGQTKAFKQFRTADDPIYTTPQERSQVKVRMREYPRKLKAFPHMPSGVIAPERVVNDPKGGFIGYTMDFVDHSFPLSKLLNTADRTAQKISLNELTRIFLNLHDTIRELHERGIVIGDFRPENILCRNHETFIIDAESMQFGKWECHAYSEQWVDPMLCDPAETIPVRVSPANMNSDWFTFAAMLFNAITGSHPYGGTLIKNGKIVPEGRRPLNRESVFTPGTRLHPSVMKLKKLTPELRDVFRRIFETNWRGEFPRELLDNLVWTPCRKCKEEFCGNQCPKCGFIVPETAASRAGEIKVTIRDATALVAGPVLASEFQDNQLRFLQFDPEGKKLITRDGHVVGKIENPEVYRKYLILGANTGLVTGSDLFLLSESGGIRRIGQLGKDACGEPAAGGNSGCVAAIVDRKLVVTDPKQPDRLESLLDVKHPACIGFGPSCGLLLTSDDEGQLTLSAITRRGLHPVGGFPSIFGRIIKADFISCPGGIWLILATEDAGRKSSFVFATEPSGAKLQGWGKLEVSEADSIFAGQKIGFKEDGTAYLLCLSEKGGTVVEASGGRVILRRAIFSSEPGPEKILCSGRNGVIALSPAPPATAPQPVAEENEVKADPAAQSKPQARKRSQSASGRTGNRARKYSESTEKRKKRQQPQAEVSGAAANIQI